jgi:hypothetical protein
MPLFATAIFTVQAFRYWVKSGSAPVCSNPTYAMRLSFSFVTRKQKYNLFTYLRNAALLCDNMWSGKWLPIFRGKISVILWFYESLFRKECKLWRICLRSSLPWVNVFCSTTFTEVITSARPITVWRQLDTLEVGTTLFALATMQLPRVRVPGIMLCHIRRKRNAKTDT